MATLASATCHEVRPGLRVRAAQNGRSMEAEARLSEAIGAKPRIVQGGIPGGDREDPSRDAPVRAARRSLVTERRWESACEDAEMKGMPKPPLSDFIGLHLHLIR